MAYAAQSDLLLCVTQAQLVQLTDDANTKQVDAGTVSGVLDEASAVVDSYCRTRYITPLQPSTDATRITRDIAVYLLYSRRPQKMSDTVRQRYDDAIALLKDVSVGRASLDQPAGVPTPQVTGGGPVLPRCNDQRFTECNLEGFCQ